MDRQSARGNKGYFQWSSIDFFFLTPSVSPLHFVHQGRLEVGLSLYPLMECAKVLEEYVDLGTLLLATFGQCRLSGGRNAKCRGTDVVTVYP